MDSMFGSYWLPTPHSHTGWHNHRKQQQYVSFYPCYYNLMHIPCTSKMNTQLCVFRYSRRNMLPKTATDSPSLQLVPTHHIYRHLDSLIPSANNHHYLKRSLTPHLPSYPKFPQLQPQAITPTYVSFPVHSASINTTRFYPKTSLSLTICLALEYFLLAL